MAANLLFCAFAVRGAPAQVANIPRRLRLRPLAARWGWVLVCTHLATAFLVTNYVLPGRVDASASLYVVQPLLWGSLGVLSLALLRSERSSLRFPWMRITLLAVWAAGFHIASLAGAGILYGFGYSPYARAPLHMVENGLYLSTLIGGVECARAYLLNRFYDQRPFTTIAVASTIFALVLIPVSTYELIGPGEATFRIAGETFLPAFAFSVVASYLAVSGGPLPAFLYHGGILAFEWFSPILPALDWTVAAFVETMAPLLALVAVRGALQEGVPQTSADQRIDVSAPWVFISALLVAALWFNSGLFGVRPAIVAGVSMEPSMHTGDLAITREVDPRDLEVGDVVRFRGDAVAIMHRIIEIEDTDQGRVFVTQGDNNNAPDAPIVEAQIEGEVITTIPKIGWLPIALNKLLNGLQ